MDVSMYLRNEIDNTSDYSHFMTSVVGEGLDRYLPPIYLVMGSICNVLAILVLRTRYFSFYSSACYMIGGAVMDQINLSQALLTRWLWVNTPSMFSQNAFFPYLCKAYNYLGAVTSDMCSIIIVTAVVERSIAVTFPRKSRKLCTVRKARLTMWGLSFLCLLKNSLLVHTVYSETESDLVLCKDEPSTITLTYLVGLILPVVHYTIVFLGFLLILASSVVILRCPRSHYVVLAQRHNLRHRRRNTREVMVNCECHLSRMVMADALVHVALTSSSTAYLFLADFSPREPAIPAPQSLHPIFFFLAYYLLYLDRCISFLLYIKIGSRFRHAVKMEFCADTGSYERNTVVTFSGIRMIHDIGSRDSPTPSMELDSIKLAKCPELDPTQDLVREICQRFESSLVTEQKHIARSDWSSDSDTYLGWKRTFLKGTSTDTTSSSETSAEHIPAKAKDSLALCHRYAASLPDDWGRSGDFDDDEIEDVDEGDDDFCFQDKTKVGPLGIHGEEAKEKDVEDAEVPPRLTQSCQGLNQAGDDHTKRLAQFFPTNSGDEECDKR